MNKAKYQALAKVLTELYPDFELDNMRLESGTWWYYNNDDKVILGVGLDQSVRRMERIRDLRKAREAERLANTLTT